ncbi:MAG: hypothetical protein ACR2MG_02645 [Pyrinomonadaceae bacterium]
MVEMTIEVRDSLAPQIQSFGGWISTIIELATANFKMSAPQKASAELIGFLSTNPLPQEVLNFEISDAAQERASFLLDLNREQEIGEAENKELDEWEKFNHICILLSAQAAKLSRT